MRRERLVYFLLPAFTLALSTAATAGELPRELTSAYRPAVERLKDGYTKISIEGTSTLVLPDDRFRAQEFIMRADGKRRRLDVKIADQRGMKLKVGAIEMRMATPYGSLVTYTLPDSEFFDDARETSYNDTVAEIDSGSLMNYPYALDSNGTILDMLLSPGVKVTGVRKFKAEGLPMVEIKYQERGTYAGYYGVWDSSLVLSPAEGWALRGFTRTSGRFTQRANVSYSGSEEGIPLLSSIETETVANGRATRRESILVNQIKLGAPDDYFFTAFAY
jgi:hypothetical protein